MTKCVLCNRFIIINTLWFYKIEMTELSPCNSLAMSGKIIERKIIYCMKIVWLLCLYNLYKRQSVLLKGMPFIDWPVLSCDQCIIIAAMFKTRTSVELTMIKHFNNVALE